MIVSASQKPVFRFAPSPNGLLHLGHALSAFINHDMARSTGGRLLLRIEDIDLVRCTPDYETALLADLAWLDLSFDGPTRRQSDHFGDYSDALDRLIAQGLVYPAFMTRGEVKAHVAAFESETGEPWPRDPDGSPLYPPADRQRTSAEREGLLASGIGHAWRLDVARALERIDEPLSWQETGDIETGMLKADPAAWGDVVLSRSDAASSYHLSVTVDDALQGITHVVRGLDLFQATGVHRLLQHLLGLPAPIYHHHRLVIGPDGRKLSKSFGDTGLAALRADGASPADIRRLVGL